MKKYYRDSSCASFSVLGELKYGRLQTIYQETRIATGRNFFWIAVTEHRVLKQAGVGGRFKYQLLLDRTPKPRELVIKMRSLKSKFIFLSLSTFPKIRQKEFMVATKLLVHVTDPESAKDLL